MADKPQGDDELIDLIYAALLGETSWQAFVDRLSDDMPNGKTVLFFHDAVKAKGSYSLTAGLDEAAVAAHNSYYSTINPWMPRASVRKVGVGVVADQMLPHAELVETEFFNDFLLPNGVRSAVGVTIDRADGRSFLLSTMTSRADADENRHHADRLTRLAPHLKRASDFYRRARSGSAGAALDASLFDAVDIGLIVVGDDARVKATSDTGQRMLEEGCGVRTGPFGRLRCACAETQHALGAMLERDYGGPKVARYVSCGIRITLIRVEKDHIALYFEGPTVVLLMERLGAPRRGFDPAYLALASGLSKAETRALAGIIQGKSISRIAAEASLSRETIRSQLKSVYAKTGASSQSDLVRWAYNLVDAGGPSGGEGGETEQ